MATITSSSTPVYAVERLAEGSERWAFTRNGVVLSTHRYAASAEREVNLAQFWVEEMGHESNTVTLLLSRVVGTLPAQVDAAPYGAMLVQDTDHGTVVLAARIGVDGAWLCTNGTTGTYRNVAETIAWLRVFAGGLRVVTVDLSA